ncbi:MAG: BatA domain-containing protein [Pirellulales bacterium]|nr:BatA domain-containing protein [Pirellulales bacterium]
MLFAWGFTDAALLGWLAAALAPLILHLWRRRQRREIPWAAMRFLTAAYNKQARHLRVRQWLLMALRMLILACIALAAARPFWNSTQLTPVENQPTLSLLVVDVSYSLGAVETAEQRLRLAKNQLVKLVEGSRAGDGFCLIQMGSAPRVVISQPTPARASVLREIEAVQLSQSPADVPATLTALSRLLQSPAVRGSAYPRQRIEIVTDLGRNSWQSLQTPPGSAALEQLSLAGGDDALIRVWDVGTTTPNNVAVESLTPGASLPFVRQAIPLSATLRNYGNRPQTVRVEFLVAGVLHQEWTLTLAPRAAQSLAWEHRFGQGGWHGLTLRCQGDDLSTDNQRFAVCHVREQARVLIVNGPAAPPSANYLRYALEAISVGDGPGASPRVTAQVATEAAWGTLDLTKFDAIWLADVARLSPSEHRLLREYLARGGKVAWWLGPRARPDALFPTATPDQASLWPAEIGEQQAAGETAWRIDPREYKHPIAKIFAGQERAGLRQTPLYAYWRLSPRQSANVEIPLAVQGTGDPLVVIGRGAWRGTAMVAIPPHLEVAASGNEQPARPWSLMPALQSFQPIVQSLLEYQLAQDNLTRQIIVNETLAGPWFPGDPLPATLQPVDKPTEVPPSGDLPSTSAAAGTRVPLQTQVDPRDPAWQRWQSDPLPASGIYQALSPEHPPELFAVNVDTRESDLTPYEPAGWPTGWQVNASETDPLASGGLFYQRGGLHEYLLWLALALAVGESWLAWSLGRNAS